MWRVKGGCGGPIHLSKGEAFANEIRLIGDPRMAWTPIKPATLCECLAPTFDPIGFEVCDGGRSRWHSAEKLSIQWDGQADLACV
jgi:hypothetical protein